jgi:hypothetical protein
VTLARNAYMSLRRVYHPKFNRENGDYLKKSILWYWPTHSIVVFEYILSEKKSSSGSVGALLNKGGTQRDRVTGGNIIPQRALVVLR